MTRRVASPVENTDRRRGDDKQEGPFPSPRKGSGNGP